MEAGSRRAETKSPENRRAVACFVLLAFFLTFVFITHPGPDYESLARSLGFLAGAIFAFMMMRRDRSRNVSDARGHAQVQRSARSVTFRLLYVVGLVLIAVAVFYLFDALLANLWKAFVPQILSALISGAVSGGGFGLIIYHFSSYEGSLWLSGEEMSHALRSLKIAVAVILAVLLFVVGLYVAVEHVAGPVIRALA